MMVAAAWLASIVLVFWAGMRLERTRWNQRFSSWDAGWKDGWDARSSVGERA